jgi:hypothetical protein
MSPLIAELKFPHRRAARRRGRHRLACDDPLREMAAQIRDLDAASERAAAAIAAALTGVKTGQPTRWDDLVSELAGALVERTAEIRSDCDRLSELVERTAALIAEQEGAAAVSERASVADLRAKLGQTDVAKRDNPRWPTDADELITLARRHLDAAGVVESQA